MKKDKEFQHVNLPAPAFLFFFETRSSAAKEAMFFILACAAALFRSDKAAFRRRRSFILVMIAYWSKNSARALKETDGQCHTSCSRRSLVVHSSKLFSRSPSSRLSSASFSSRSLSFSRLARALASNPAFMSFCFFFSFSPSSSSCGKENSELRPYQAM